MSEKIRVFKLASGAELIGRVDEDGETPYTILVKRALVLFVQKGHGGEAAVGLLPYVVSDAEGDILLYKSAIEAEPLNINKNLEDGYLQQTSGIVLTSQGR